MNATEKRAALATAVRSGKIVVAAGVYDMISAKVADRIGFMALYMTGYGVAASHLGLPDAGIATYTDVVERVRRIAGGTGTPLICDADTGFGGLLNVKYTIEGFEDAGCSAIQIEDQEIPKKCGHTPGRRVVPVEDMVDKIRVAVDSRKDPNFLIIARTDSRTTLGLDEALSRGKAFHEAGADVVFVESPESEEELAAVGKAFPGIPLLANMSDFGKTPILPADKLEELGFAISIFPGLSFLAAAGALDSAYRTLLAEGTSDNVTVPRLSLPEMHKLMGFEEVWEFEKRYARPEAAE